MNGWIWTGLSIVAAIFLFYVIRKLWHRYKRHGNNYSTQDLWNMNIPQMSGSLQYNGVYYAYFIYCAPTGGEPSVSYSAGNGSGPYGSIQYYGQSLINSDGTLNTNIGGQYIAANETSGGKYAAIAVGVNQSVVECYTCSAAPLAPDASRSWVTFVRMDGNGQVSQQSCFTSPWGFITNKELAGNDTTIRNACFPNMCTYLLGQSQYVSGECSQVIATVSAQSGAMTNDINSGIYNQGQVLPGWLASECGINGNPPTIQNPLMTNLPYQVYESNPWENMTLQIGGTVLQSWLEGLMATFLFL